MPTIFGYEIIFVPKRNVRKTQCIIVQVKSSVLINTDQEASCFSCSANSFSLNR